ncbi:MAG TPA: DUF5009 domain-containing protein [Saprospiraceae bacterium]|nr:DUF5009 domain-containing protein [Saprospiraceae bacterium]
MTTTQKRLISLDALRGFTIAGMIIVNSPGSWSHIYTPLEHAEWNGVTPTDYVFPFFLFIVGVSIALAYQKKLDANVDKKKMLSKIIWRSIKIYALGIFLWLWHRDFDFAHIRWVGVLPRIAFVFLPCALLFLYTDWKQQLKIAIAILIGYWILMAYVPVPGIGTPDLSEPMKNWANWIDSRYLPGVMWQKIWDPEGFLSTLPAIATGISGMLMGRIILDIREDYQKISHLFFWGFVMLIIGGIWNWFFPYNKNLWSSSYVLHTSGLATLALASLYLVVDIWNKKNWTTLGRVFGANAITSYVLSGLLISIFYESVFGMPALNESFMNTLTSVGADPKFASMLYAIIYMLVIYIPAYVLYKSKIFIKL